MKDFLENDRLWKGIAIFLKGYAYTVVGLFFVGVFAGEFIFDDDVVNAIYYIFLTASIIFEVVALLYSTFTQPVAKFKISDILAVMLVTAAAGRFFFQVEDDGELLMLILGVVACLIVSWLTKPIVITLHFKE